MYSFIILKFYVFSSRNKHLKTLENASETRRVETLNLGEPLYSVEFEIKNLIRKLEKLIRNFVNINLRALFNQVCINEKLLPICTHNIYILKVDC